MTNNNVNYEEIDHILKNNKGKPSEEETHSFLLISNSEEEPGKGLSPKMTTLEKGLWPRARKNGSSICKFGDNNCIGLCIFMTLALLGVSVLCLEIYRGNEAMQLRSDLDALRRDFDSLKHRLSEEDIMSELKAFEEAAYTDDEAFDDSDDEFTEYTTLDQDQGDHHAKHQNTDLPTKILDHSSTHKHSSHARDHDDEGWVAVGKRNKREAHGRIDGAALPIIAGSYGVPNKTEGLRLYESLVSNQEVSQETGSTETSTTETPIQYHRASGSWNPKQHRKKYHQRSQSQEVDGHPRQRPKSTQAPAAIISRPSRVMKTDKDPSRRVSQPYPPLPAPQELREQRPATVAPQQTTKKPHEGEILFRVYQEQRAAPESTVREVDVLEEIDRNRQRRRKSKPARRISSLEGLDERQPNHTKHRLTPAAHFNGDSSGYSQAHEHYDGNGRLRHPDGVFTDWAPSKWVQQLGMDNHFKFEEGAVTIKDTGLYFVYAQIHYLDEHDINGYRVYVNEDPMMQCTTMTHSMGGDRIKKSNTCFTAAALYLTANDRLSLSDIGGLRYSLFEATKSFFGLIKLGSINIK